MKDLIMTPVENYLKQVSFLVTSARKKVKSLTQKRELERYFLKDFPHFEIISMFRQFLLDLEKQHEEKVLLMQAKITELEEEIHNLRVKTCFLPEYDELMDDLI